MYYRPAMQVMRTIPSPVIFFETLNNPISNVNPDMHMYAGDQDAVCEGMPEKYGAGPGFFKQSTYLHQIRALQLIQNLTP